MTRDIQVRIPAEMDKKLQGVCPTYIRGVKCATRRVEWAIEKALESALDGADVDGEERVEPVGDSTGGA